MPAWSIHHLPATVCEVQAARLRAWQDCYRHSTCPKHEEQENVDVVNGPQRRAGMTMVALS